jgi:hypothetical protein
LLVPLVAATAVPRTLLLYDRAAGDSAALAFDAWGGVRQLRPFSDWRTSWTAIVASGFPRATGVGGLVAYGLATGTVALYATDWAPLPTPTPAPTRTPVPTPTPTPTIVPIDRVTIWLEQGRGDDWSRYSANVGEPHIGVSGQGYITSVRSTSDRRIALTHRDRAGARTTPVFLKVDETSKAVDGMLVAGA